MKIIKLLGNGTFGSVFLYQIEEKLYAVKRVVNSNISQNEILYHTIVNGHPNIIGLNNTVVEEDNTYIVLDYAEKGDLFKYIKDVKVLNEAITQFYMIQLFNAVDYCHKSEIAHCDIKLENIFLDKYYNIKLGDFGYSRHIKTDPKLISGTIHYMAPEILQKNIIDDCKIDIYACGICMYIMLHGIYPFNGSNLSETIKSIKIHKYELSSNLTNECKDLLHQLLEFYPSKRISMEEIKKHPWLNEDYSVKTNKLRIVTTYTPLLTT
jgi:serine/threonine protein kinase